MRSFNEYYFQSNRALLIGNSYHGCGGSSSALPRFLPLCSWQCPRESQIKEIIGPKDKETEVAFSPGSASYLTFSPGFIFSKIRIAPPSQGNYECNVKAWRVFSEGLILTSDTQSMTMLLKRLEIVLPKEAYFSWSSENGLCTLPKALKSI